MSKRFKPLKKFGKAIYKLFDKILITPISKLVYRITNRTKKNNGSLEKLLNNPKVLIYVSLVFAITTFVLVNFKVIDLVETDAEVINDQSVEVLYNEEAFVIEGLPKTVDITLIGRKSDLYLAKQLGEHDIKLDLTDLSVGEHKVKLTYNQTIDSIDYNLNPSSVLVVIKEKISKIKTVSYDLLNGDKLDAKLSVSEVTLSDNEVVVKGSEEALDKVATVKALVDLNNSALTGAGKFTLDSVNLVAYNDSGQILNNVEIVPGKITADITLNSYSAEVPIKVLTTGQLTTGYAIKTLESSVSKVTIYGDKEAIDKTKFIPVTIDVTDLKEEKTSNITITKPSGIKYISETSTTVKATIDTETTKVIEDVIITIRNKKDSYTATAKSSKYVTVTLKGVSSVLENIDDVPIEVYIDLSGYGPGTHSVPLNVETSDPRIECVLTTKTVDIVITSN